MKRFPLFPVALLLGIATLLPIASAHVPIQPGENETLADATVIEDPLKSWAIYGSLAEGPQYYRFDLQTGDPMYLGLMVPPLEAERGFAPSLVLLIPGVEDEGTAPPDVTVPPGYGAVTLEGQLAPEATYEPFGPGSFYWLGELRRPAPVTGTYYAAVVPENGGGNYGLVVGVRESFTLQEWVLTPLNVLSVYRWEGQGLLFIFAPLVAVTAAGLALSGVVLRREERGRDIQGWAGSLAGSLYLGSGAVILTQMAWALTTAPLEGFVGITLALALLPLGLGAALLRISWRASGLRDLRGRIKVALLAGGGLFAWAGFLLGPALAAFASLVPARSRAQRRTAEGPGDAKA